MTLHRTFVMAHTQHVHTVRQKIEESSWNHRVRILRVKNFLCVRQHCRNNSLLAGKLHVYCVNYKMLNVQAHAVFSAPCKENEWEKLFSSQTEETPEARNFLMEYLGLDSIVNGGNQTSKWPKKICLSRL